MKNTSDGFKKWQNTTANILEQVCGRESSHYENFMLIDYSSINVLVDLNNKDINRILDTTRKEEYQQGLNTAKEVLQGIIEGIDKFGLPNNKETKLEPNPQQIININQNQKVHITIENIFRDRLTSKQFEELIAILNEKNNEQKEKKIVGFFKKIGETIMIEIFKSLVTQALWH